jgi:hypothetical protein
MLKSERKFGFPTAYKKFFTDTSDSVDSAILRKASVCPNVSTCLIWASVYHNTSTILSDIEMENVRRKKNWTDENNRPVLFELQDGVVRTLEFVILFKKRSPFFEIIGDIIGHILEGGFFLHIKKGVIDREKSESKFDYPALEYSYSAINISQLQTAFYILMLGYIVALVCFVIEIVWHCYMSKVSAVLSSSLCHSLK